MQRRRYSELVLALGWVLVAWAHGCGDKRRADTIETTPIGNRPPSYDGGEASDVLTGAGTAGVDRAGSAGGGAGGGGALVAGATHAGGAGGAGEVPRGPEVTITHPVATDDPASGDVLTADSVEVRCLARQSTAPGSSPVASSTVKIALLDASGALVQELPGVATGLADEYAASFVIATLPTAPVSFRCTARDTATTPLPGETTIGTFVDNGPTVSLLEPERDEIVPLLGAVHVEFEVLPAPLSDDDEQAEIDAIALTLAGVDIPPCGAGSEPCFAPKPGAEGVYVADVDFTDGLVFSPTPTLVSAIVSATNRRAPQAATRAAEGQFTLDGEGPTITLKQPNVAGGAVFGGEIIVEFTLDDPAGVDPDSIVVEIDGDPYRYPSEGAWAFSNGTYRFRFDTANIVALSQLSIRVLARDVVQNDAPGGGKTVLVPIDNVSPIVDLDPGNVREMAWANKTAGTTKCTVSFDPLGSGSPFSPPNDGDVLVGTYGAIFRALIVDRSNGSPGDPTVSFAHIDNTTVWLYAKPAAAAEAAPLVYDASGDGVCDTVDETTPAFVQLFPLAPDTRAYYPDEAHLTDAAVAPAWACDAYGTATAPPENLCNSYSPDLYHVIKHPCPTSNEPAVYANQPAAGGDCTGQTWLVTNEESVGEGWICLAARATDRVGNGAISAPLRVCIDAPDDGTTPDCSLAAMPSCTDGCSSPPRFEAQILDRLN